MVSVLFSLSVVIPTNSIHHCSFPWLQPSPIPWWLSCMFLLLRPLPLALSLHITTAYWTTSLDCSIGTIQNFHPLRHRELELIPQPLLSLLLKSPQSPEAYRVYLFTMYSDSATASVHFLMFQSMEETLLSSESLKCCNREHL